MYLRTYAVEPARPRVLVSTDLESSQLKGVLPLIHAEGADPVGVFAANLTLPDWCLVKAQKA